MACALNQEQVLDVYEVLIGDILELGENTPFQLDTIIKDFYKVPMLLCLWMIKEGIKQVHR